MSEKTLDEIPDGIPVVDIRRASEESRLSTFIDALPVAVFVRGVRRQKALPQAED